MSKYEIRLRRQKFTSRGSERFRNYGAVLQRYEKEMRIKKLVRVFSLLFIILIVVMLIIILVNFFTDELIKVVNPRLRGGN